MGKLYSATILILALLSFSRIHAQQVTEKTVLDLVKTNAAQLHISAADAGNASVSSYFTDAGTGILYTYIQQTWKSIKVHNTIITAAFRDSKLLYTSGRFVNDIALKTGQPVPSIEADQAVIRSAQHLQLAAPVNLQTITNKFVAEKKIMFSPAGIAKQNIEAELFWVTDDELQNVRLAWNINIDVAGSSDWWNVRIDALNGNVIDKDNWTVHENIPGVTNTNNNISAGSQNTNHVIADQKKTGIGPLPPPAVTNASYKVIRFPAESPINGSVGIENEPWLKAGAVNNATTNGWHFDGTTDYNITRGNNVFAYLDILNNNTASITNFPDTSTTAIPALNFINTQNFTLQPFTTINRKFAVDNLFYWNNQMHDVMYQYGFNEVSGNFQADNLGRGGTGNDFVRAEAQDASGTDNANFSTPADGGSGRMQMYLFSAVPSFVVNTPANIAGSYTATESGFSTNNKLLNTGPVTGQVAYYDDNAGGTTHEACAAPFNSIAGKIALIVRGTCAFTVKVKDAQDAGAIAVIMVNNIPGAPITMGGNDNTITIPAVMISQSNGALLASELINNVNVTLAAGVNLDGDLDNGVICHEYGHGISNRLTGGRLNASCLNNAEEGGEGWSDYLALMMVTNWSTAQLTDGNISRPMGTYVLGQQPNGSGIRTYPYTMNMSVNPHTYADLANVSTEVHYIGEVWTSALWDMTWNIIQQEGVIDPDIYNATGPGGNAIALRLVMEGMRLQSCRPGFLDARNAILAADSILYNYKHKCAIWNAFARRGMGYSAVQGSSGSATDQVAAYDVPSSVTLTKSTSPIAITGGHQVTVNFSASCQCQAPLNNFVIRDTIPAGFNYVSSTGGTLNGNVVTFSPVNFSTTLETKTYSVTLQSITAGCNIDTSINDNRDGATTGGLTPAAITGTTQWVQSNLRSGSPANSWFAADVAGTRDFTLTSNAFIAGSLSVLSFKQYYVAENYIDGGRIEISPDNGVTWSDAGKYIVQNGYNTTMNATSPWGNGQPAISGVSYAQGSGQFINTVLDLSSFSGQQVMIRLRMRSNANNASNSTYEGWFVDDILQMNGCGGIVRAGLYNLSGTRIDSSVVPVFVRPSMTVSIATQPTNVAVCDGSTVTLIVAADGDPSPVYKWQVSTNGGVTYNDIAGQTLSTLTFTATAAMNGYRYRSVASNLFTSATSNAVTLVVYNLAAITAQPASVTLCPGTNANFTMTAAGSPGPLVYQWQVSTDGGVTYNNIAGQTSPALTFATTAAMNGYRYRCTVTSYCNTVNSNAATLTLNTQTVLTIRNLVPKICLNDPAIPLEVTPIGGVWSGTGVSGNNFLPSSTAAGAYTLTYTYTNGPGCVTKGTTIAKVEDCPERIILLRDNAVLLYPNPNNGQFNIRINSVLYNYLTMKVYANNGVLLRTQQLGGLAWGRVIPIDLTYLPGGAYMIKFYYVGGVRTSEKIFKVVIGH